ncbi:MAG: hypothetical protein ACQEXV_23875 [Bacillota bacterium]
MKWHVFVCESCHLGFALEQFDPEWAICPNPECEGDDVTGTGEIIRDPHIEFNRKEEVIN